MLRVAPCCRLATIVNYVTEPEPDFDTFVTIFMCYNPFT